jgi:cell division protein FtsB
MAHRKKKVSHLRELFYVLFILAVVTFGLFSVWGPRGYFAMKKGQIELETHRARLAALEQRIDERAKTVQDLKSNRQKIEELARKQHYARPGEIILQTAPQPQK